jgi:two-component system OmpR family response regulator
VFFVDFQHRCSDVFERSIDVLISRLRKRIEKNPHNPDFIKTVRSGGYMFENNVEKVNME